MANTDLSNMHAFGLCEEARGHGQNWCMHRKISKLHTKKPKLRFEPETFSTKPDFFQTLIKQCYMWTNYKMVVSAGWLVEWWKQKQTNKKTIRISWHTLWKLNYVRDRRDWNLQRSPWMYWGLVFVSWEQLIWWHHMQHWQVTQVNLDTVYNLMEIQSTVQ